jgi:hypothetical protein
MTTVEDFILPTYYKGIKFRSRTEARWAKFFDVAGIKYHYEPEAIMLKSGPYLPDFEISTGYCKTVYVEVKGVFSEQEKNRCLELSSLTKKPVLMLDGAPYFKTYGLYKHEGVYQDGQINPVGEPILLDVIVCTAGCKYSPFFYNPGFEDKEGYFKPEDWYEEYKDAIYQALDERFGIFQ